MDEEQRQKEIARKKEMSIKANLTIRALCKCVLESLGYCIVVAGLFYVARQSGYWWLYAITGIGFFALGVYCYTYIENIWFSSDVPHVGWLKTSAIILAAGIVLGSVQVGIAVGLTVTLDKIVRVQSETKSMP